MKFLILCGDGINCERETKIAFETAGHEAEIQTLNHLLINPDDLFEYDGLALPGGFSFGDDLGSGRVFAQKIKKGLGSGFFDFIKEGRPVIGICNGFQTLVQLGVLPEIGPRKLTLTFNDVGHFIDRWVSLEVNKNSPCIWTIDCPKEITLPIRHGEGKIVLLNECSEDIQNDLLKNGHIALTYKNNPNGSALDIAGLTNTRGNVLGLMPHPEASIFQATLSSVEQDFNKPADGLSFFESITI
ncbi:MAG: phosphoribosylformylglycinamidine synthase subunit PurQ [Halobacteriovoraceae bacterium]|nr:phosphoribosylformylglycinamidine synthase subunit PurQ [Halobacteriovoraceae bacterium]